MMSFRVGCSAMRSRRSSYTAQNPASKVGSGALLPPPEPPLEELTPTVPSPRTAPSQHASVEPFLAVVLELRPDRIAALLLETAPAATARPGAVDATPAGIAVRTRHRR